MQSNVSQQTTTIFKKGQTVRQDVDYALLHKQKLGHGTHGDVYRAWFYHLVKDVEADIVVKEVFRYFPYPFSGWSYTLSDCYRSGAEWNDIRSIVIFRGAVTLSRFTCVHTIFLRSSGLQC